MPVGRSCSVCAENILLRVSLILKITRALIINDRKDTLDNGIREKEWKETRCALSHTPFEHLLTQAVLPTNPRTISRADVIHPRHQPHATDRKLLL